VTGEVRSAVSLSPLAAVTVRLQPGDFATKTDDLGRFRVITADTGVYSLTFTRVGYEGQTVTVVLPDEVDNQMLVNLTPAVIETDNIVVTASRHPEFQSHLPLRKGVIHGIEHSINGRQHIIEMYINRDDEKKFRYFKWCYDNECPQEVVDWFRKTK